MSKESERLLPNSGVYPRFLKNTLLKVKETKQVRP
jgi:hypothetical protein